MSIDRGSETSEIWLTSRDFPDGRGLQIHRAVVREALGRLTEITMDFASSRQSLRPQDLLASRMTIHLRAGDGLPIRRFSGIVVTAEALGLKAGQRHFVVQLRPLLWVLTRSSDNRIFQDKSVIEIIKEVLSENGVSLSAFKIKEAYPKRDYCVQYRESDFDFISRLMEEEGLYYFFDHASATDSDDETLVITDNGGAHAAVAGPAKLPFKPHGSASAMGETHISEWSLREEIVSGQVSLRDYDFLSSRTDLLTKKLIASGKHRFNKAELYDYPGIYRDGARGEALARIRMEAEAVRHERRRAAGSVKTLETGRKMALEPQPGDTGFDDDGEFLITQAIYYLQETTAFRDSQTEGRIGASGIEIPESFGMFTCEFDAIPAQVPFRPERTTPQPRIAGPHTAVVTGPEGEEIHTDQHGRIKVEFHWDRRGFKDDRSSCWVRVATGWSGAGWGLVTVPRIGQEVVIQFEEGNPDRPLCTGMLYNDATRVPWDLPSNKTQSGIKTNSSVKGGGFNEMMFEDKKDVELLRVQAQRDYQQIVKNDASITIGLETGAPGNLTQVVKNDVHETIKEGNHTFLIEKGTQKIEIEGDKTETIKTGNHAFELSTGSQDVKIKTDNTLNVDGKQTRTIMGDDATTVKTGNITVTASLGKIVIEAAQSIELKVGGSSVLIDLSGVTVKGPMINVSGDAKVAVSAPMTEVKGLMMLTLKGGMTMIN